ncbi:hypothetical protein BGX28_004245 [Mortierella sp. GBA30]|nr:hypothetical protein BGX28_004245 [Mortierella sp. GBA30]
MDAVPQPLPETLSYSSRPGTPTPPAPLSLQAQNPVQVDELVLWNMDGQSSHPQPHPFQQSPCAQQLERKSYVNMPTEAMPDCPNHKPRIHHKHKRFLPPQQIHHPQPSYQPQRPVEHDKPNLAVSKDQHFSIELQRQLSFQQWQERNSTAQFTLRSQPPNPRHADAIDGYFAQGHLGQSNAVNVHSENESHSDDDNEHAGVETNGGHKQLPPSQQNARMDSLKTDVIEGPLHDSSDTQVVACDSGDDSDQDECPNIGEYIGWDASRESSCLQSPIQDFHALNGSIEHLAALSGLRLTSLPESLNTPWDSLLTGSWRVQSTEMSEPSPRSMEEPDSATLHPTIMENYQGRCFPESNPKFDASANTHGLQHALDKSRVGRFKEISECSGNKLPPLPHTDLSPLTVQFDSLGNNEGETELTPKAPPLVPPRYPEISARSFDLPEEEGPDTIVYASTSMSKQDTPSGSELPPIIAATIVKLIEKLTHQYGMDSGFVTDFFLTYRLFMSPVQLCKYLIQRYLWALEQDTESRLIVRVRTFVVLRYWIKEHFVDDFLTSKSLRFQMASFLNEMRFHPCIKASALDARIIRYLMEFFKHQRRYYKKLAQQSLDTEQERGDQARPSLRTDSIKGDGKVIKSSPPKDDATSIEVERLRVSAYPRETEPLTVKVATSDVTETSQQSSAFKGRLRASTLAGPPSRPLAGETLEAQLHAKPPLSKECRVQSMARQTSEGGSFFARERRLSNSSTKSNRSTSNWSSKMTIGISKLKQKSEDIYQQFVNPSIGLHRGDTRLCVCWTPAYTGINEHHTLSTARSFPSLRPSVVVTNVFQDAASPQTSMMNTASSPSSKSIKRLKSSLSLGLSSPNASSSPAPSPTRNQFSGIYVRHSRSNSNISTGYHPNPECPFHIPCSEPLNKDTLKISEEPPDDSSLKTLMEALQDDYADVVSFQSVLPSFASSVPPSPAWQGSPWHTPGTFNSPSTTTPPYKPFILFYRSQMIAQQLCLLEQHFLEQVKWDELLELELSKAGRKNRVKTQSSISGFLFKIEGERNGMEASNERSNMLCMWVASEVVSTRPLEDRVRVIEKFIRIAQKCYQYRNFNSLMQLVMGLGSSHLCGLRRTWSRVNGYEMRVLQDLQDFISPCGNWSVIRRAMSQVGHQDVQSEQSQRLSMQGADFGTGTTTIPVVSSGGPKGIESNAPVALSSELGHSKYLQHQVPLEKQGCIPFLGLFVFDLTHIAVSPPWYLPSTQSSDSTDSDSPGLGSVPPTPMGASYPATAAHLQAPEPKDLQELLPTGTLLVHFHRYQLIAKTVKWFVAFQRRTQKYTFPLDSTLYSKCLLLRVLSHDRVRELADVCEID